MPALTHLNAKRQSLRVYFGEESGMQGVVGIQALQVEIDGDQIVDRMT
jgi:hypothetical protein